MKTVYKIVEMGPFGNYTTLFHGINGSKILKRKVWIKALEKYVKDGSGGKTYLSGIHCFKDSEIALQYLSRFTNIENKLIIKCFAHGLRVKPTNPNVFLA